MSSVDAAVAIAHICLGASGRSGPDTTSELDKQRIAEAVRYINENFAEPCPLDTLAAVASMNRFRFARYA